MSIARIAARIAGFLVVLMVVIGVYNLGAYVLVRHVISQVEKGPKFPTARELETSFEIPEFKGLGDGIIYKPDRDHFGNR